MKPRLILKTFLKTMIIGQMSILSTTLICALLTLVGIL